MVEMLRTLPDKKQADTPAILLVSQPTKELVTRAAATQIRHVVAKPFTAGVLYGHIRCALGLGAYVPSPNQGFLAAKNCYTRDGSARPHRVRVLWKYLTAVRVECQWVHQEAQRKHNKAATGGDIH
jgi:CheY-like chemotaxis protein